MTDQEQSSSAAQRRIAQIREELVPCLPKSGEESSSFDELLQKRIDVFMDDSKLGSEEQAESLYYVFVWMCLKRESEEKEEDQEERTKTTGLDVVMLQLIATHIVAFWPEREAELLQLVLKEIQVNAKILQQNEIEIQIESEEAQLEDLRKKSEELVSRRKELQLRAEQEKVNPYEHAMKLIRAAPIMPQEAGEKYFLIAMAWWQHFKAKYHVQGEEEEGETPMGDPDELVTGRLNEMSLKDEEEKKTVEDLPPINTQDAISGILVNEQFLRHEQDPHNNMHLRTTAKEDEDFVIVGEDVWAFLKKRFEVENAIPRFSIEAEKESEEDESQFLVEVYLKKINIYILPKQKNHLVLKKASPVFVSRKYTVRQLKLFIAEILYHNKKDFTIEELMTMSRLWRLDTGESIQDIESYLESEMDSIQNFPLQVRGRVLQWDEVLMNINVADEDVLMYEVYYSKRLVQNKGFAFTSKKVKKSAQKKTAAQDLTEKQIMELSLEKGFGDGMRNGLTGLQNLGNTCFMNSVIQCLANTDPLVKYFLFDCYQNHINDRNPLGTRGRLAISFADLLNELYRGDSPYVAPWDVKNIIARRAIQFQGFAQHDSQEMLSFLLETLHEDLNDVVKKPYIEYSDSNDRSDQEVSKEYWEGFLKRESSIFVEKFYGQLKSRVQCTVCSKISISFDPFNMLSVPIPTSKEFRLSIKYFPLNINVRAKEFQLTVGDYATVSEVRQKVMDHICEETKQPPFFTRVRNKNILELVGKDKFVKSILEKGDEICALERPPPSPGHDEVFLLEVKVCQNKRSFMVFNSMQQITYSRLFVIDRKQTVKDVRKKIFEFFRPLIMCPQEVLQKLKERRGDNLTQEQILEEEYRYFFDNPKMFPTPTMHPEVEHPLYQIMINNNVPLDQGIFFSTKFQCEFCHKVHTGNCPFAFKDNMVMKQVLSKIEHDRDFELVIQWNQNPMANLKQLENGEYEQINLAQPSSAQVKTSKHGLSLYDCLNWFSQEETLTGNDKWYCSNCKEHQNALKKMEVYKCPEFLIVHIKRFSHQRQSFFSSRKIQELVDFPVDGLNLQSFVIGNKDKPLVYDLYGVSNHYGSLNGGHYTAFCMNPINRRWYEFDDTSVSKMSPGQVVGKAAYVLFYKLRKP